MRPGMAMHAGSLEHFVSLEKPRLKIRDLSGMHL
jgi:hypothetical protein